MIRSPLSKVFAAAAACLALIVSMAAPAAAQSSGWQGGPGAILDNTYVGFIDQPSSGAGRAGQRILCRRRLVRRHHRPGLGRR